MQVEKDRTDLVVDILVYMPNNFDSSSIVAARSNP